MTKTKTLFIAAIIAWQTPPIGTAMAALCITTQDFQLTCSSGQQCCPNGKYTTRYACPENYTLSYLDNTCSRSSTSGSDNTGYYTQNYGTCDATSSQVECCDISMGSNIKCLACIGEQL